MRCSRELLPAGNGLCIVLHLRLLALVASLLLVVVACEEPRRVTEQSASLGSFIEQGATCSAASDDVDVSEEPSTTEDDLDGEGEVTPLADKPKAFFPGGWVVIEIDPKFTDDEIFDMHMKRDGQTWGIGRMRGYAGDKARHFVHCIANEPTITVTALGTKVIPNPALETDPNNLAKTIRVTDPTRDLTNLIEVVTFKRPNLPNGGEDYVIQINKKKK